MLFELTQGQKEELLNKKRGHSSSVMSTLLDHSQKRVKKKDEAPIGKSVSQEPQDRILHHHSRWCHRNLLSDEILLQYAA